jgi:DNA polymerase-3 subunit epsilon
MPAANTPDQYELERLAKLLELSADFKVSRRLLVREMYAEPDGRPLLHGVLVDTETTGLDLEADQIIELAVLSFEFDPESGQVFRILGAYDGLEDPGRPIPPEATAVHGITDAMVAGKRVDDARVQELVEGADIVIAHNAEFDRPFLERRLPLFETLPWACSYRQIDWTAEGIGSAKLEYVAYVSGFFFDAHRAEMDCRATLEILQTPLPMSAESPLKLLYSRLNQKDWRVYALGSPFDSKDLLKERSYRWDAQRKVWHRTMDEAATREEISWLKANVYKREKVLLEFEGLDALTRFSTRPGKSVRKEV